MNGWHRAADFLEGYAALSETRAAGMKVSGDRIVALKVWLKSCPDPKAFRFSREVKMGRLLRCLSEWQRQQGDRADARSEAVTPTEPMVIAHSFVDEDT